MLPCKTRTRSCYMAYKTGTVNTYSTLVFLMSVSKLPDAGNHYNCPIVTSYGENIKNNIEELRDDKIKYQNPFISLESEEILTKRLVDFFRKENGIPAAEIKAAAHEGWLEMQAVREDMTKKGKEVLQYLKETGRHGIVLAGRPYHSGP